MRNSEVLRCSISNSTMPLANTRSDCFTQITQVYGFGFNRLHQIALRHNKCQLPFQKVGFWLN